MLREKLTVDTAKFIAHYITSTCCWIDNMLVYNICALNDDGRGREGKDWELHFRILNCSAVDEDEDKRMFSNKVDPRTNRRKRYAKFDQRIWLNGKNVKMAENQLRIEGPDKTNLYISPYLLQPAE